MYPFIHIFNRMIPMYGLCIVIGVFAAAIYIVHRCKKENLCWENAVIIGITGLGTGLIGAKLLYVIVTFKPEEIINIIFKDSSLIFNGGFVFYGGLIGGVFGAVLGAMLAKCKLKDYENILILSIPLVHFFGRIGCLCAGCCYGKPTSSGISVVYENPIASAPVGVPLIPIQLYEAVYNLFVFTILIFIQKKTGKDGILLPFYLILYAVGRFVIEFFRYDYSRGIYAGLSTSQLISLCLIIFAIVLFVYRKHINFIEKTAHE